VILSGNRPHWFDRICHYNPTSILWRYFAILDRRLRCLDWKASDMAASNAHFWRGHSWDSSEEMMIYSRQFSTRAPTHAYVKPLSVSAAKTLVITLQGAQAFYELLGTVTSHSTYALTTNLSTAFFPLAVFGLLRLPAAIWMSEEWAYSDEDLKEVRAVSPKHDGDTSKYQKISAEEKSTESAVTTGVVVEPQDDQTVPRFRPANGLRGIVVRASYLLVTLALAAFTTYQALPTGSQRSYMSATLFTQIILFLFLLLGTSLIFLYYFIRGESTTTIIPCLNSVWYKLYTAVLLLGMLVLIIFGTIETRKTWCGTWTTYPKSVPGSPDAEFIYCPRWINIQTSELSWVEKNGTSNGTSIVRNFNGLITGKWSSANLSEDGT
jgi:hypothetical protein